MIYQALYYAQLIVYQGGGRFQSLTEVRAFPAQSARLCLLRLKSEQAILLITMDWPLCRFGKHVAELR